MAKPGLKHIIAYGELVFTIVFNLLLLIRFLRAKRTPGRDSMQPQELSTNHNHSYNKHERLSAFSQTPLATTTIFQTFLKRTFLVRDNVFSKILTKEGEAGYCRELRGTKGIEEALVTPLIVQGGIPEGNS